jgi:acyl carrier protein
VDAAELIGPMVNELPVTTEPDAGATFDSFARALRGTLRSVYPHREVPLARAVGRIRPHAALAPISVSYRRRRPEPTFTGVDSTVDWTAFNGAVRGDLQLQLVDDGTHLSASLRYSPAAAPVAAIFAEQLRSATERLAAAPALPVADLLEGPRDAETPEDANATAELADRIRAIWEEVLGISPIGDDDDLFDLGGHSLTMTQIIARMRKNLRIDVPLDAFFDDPTVSGVVRAVRGDQ